MLRLAAYTESQLMAAGYGLVIMLNPPAAVDNGFVKLLTVPCTTDPVALKVVVLEGNGIGFGATLVLNIFMFVERSPLKNKKYPVMALSELVVLGTDVYPGDTPFVVKYNEAALVPVTSNPLALPPGPVICVP